MKLAILLSRFPYPLEKGDKLRAYHQIKTLSASHEIHLFCLTDTEVLPEWKKEVEQYCEQLHIYKLRKPLIYLNTALKLFSDQPFQVGYFYQAGINRKINQKIEQLQPDHIYCQLVRTAEYLKNIHNIPKTIDYQDALSKGMFRRAEIASGFKKRLYRAEGKRLSEYENRIFDYFNHHTIISEQDKAFINHPSADEIVVVENGISEDFFSYTKPYEVKHDLAFVGNMNYPPNVECAEFLVREILPLLPMQTTLVLSGASPNQRILNLAIEGKVTITGWVDDIRNSYASARIFVAPLFIGTGLQNKLLEAMAMGIPCITTALVNNALHATDGEHLVEADTAQSFANEVLKLLNDAMKADEMGQKACRFVKENYSWNKSVEKLEALLKGAQQ